MRLVCECHDLCHQQSMFYVPCHRHILKWITYEICVIQMRLLYYTEFQSYYQIEYTYTYILVCTMFLINHNIWLCHFAAVLHYEQVKMIVYWIWYGSTNSCINKASIFNWNLLISSLKLKQKKSKFLSLLWQ